MTSITEKRGCLWRCAWIRFACYMSKVPRRTFAYPPGQDLWLDDPESGISLLRSLAAKAMYPFAGLSEGIL